MEDDLWADKTDMALRIKRLSKRRSLRELLLVDMLR